MAQAALQHPHRQSQSDSFRRHRPEETVLYQCIEAPSAEFRERAAKVLRQKRIRHVETHATPTGRIVLLEKLPSL